jgi:ABC-type oligopeptide transport system substrate-binding subunit
LQGSPAKYRAQWQNDVYDELLEKAGRVMDQEKRMKLYTQADRILMEEAAIMPILYRRHQLVKPGVKSTLCQ